MSPEDAPQEISWETVAARHMTTHITAVVSPEELRQQIAAALRDVDTFPNGWLASEANGGPGVRAIDYRNADAVLALPAIRRALATQALVDSTLSDIEGCARAAMSQSWPGDLAEVWQKRAEHVLAFVRAVGGER